MHRPTPTTAPSALMQLAARSEAPLWPLQAASHTDHGANTRLRLPRTTSQETVLQGRRMGGRCAARHCALLTWLQAAWGRGVARHLLRGLSHCNPGGPRLGDKQCLTLRSEPPLFYRTRDRQSWQRFRVYGFLGLRVCISRGSPAVRRADADCGAARHAAVACSRAGPPV